MKSKFKRQNQKQKTRNIIEEHITRIKNNVESKKQVQEEWTIERNKAQEQ